MAGIGMVFWLTLYIAVFVPLSLIYRLVCGDPLQRRKKPGARTYWQSRRDSRFRPMTSQY